MKPTPPWSSFSYICLAIYFFLAFIFRSIKPQKNTKIPCWNLFVPRSIYPIYKFTSRPLPILRRRTPKGIDNPFNTSGCKVLFFVCRGCFRCVAWFSYWFDNLGFIFEGNTYHRCAASSLPLWGNTDVVQDNTKRNFWCCCRGDIINIYQVPNHKSHLLAIYNICHLPLVFLSPTSQKFAILFALFFFRRFLVRSTVCLQS